MAYTETGSMGEGQVEGCRHDDEFSLKHVSALETSGCSCPHASWVPPSGALGRGGLQGADMKLVGVGWWWKQ